MTAIAVLGSGRWGRLIVRDLAGLGVSVLAIDPDPEAQAAATRAGANVVANDLTGLDEVDGIVVATPASMHESHVLAVADRGVPVACEKPLATSTEAAARMHGELGDRLSVLHVWRYHPAVERLGELVRNGTLGEIGVVQTTRTNWTSPRTDVDPVWTLLPHDISIAIELFGRTPQVVGSVVDRLEDRAVGVWAHLVDQATGVPIIAEASTRHPTRRRTVRVHASEGVVVLDADASSLCLFAGSDREPVRTVIDVRHGQALEREMASFVERVNGGPPMKTDGREGVEVVDAVERVLAVGGP